MNSTEAPNQARTGVASAVGMSSVEWGNGGNKTPENQAQWWQLQEHHPA